MALRKNSLILINQGDVIFRWNSQEQSKQMESGEREVQKEVNKEMEDNMGKEHAEDIYFIKKQDPWCPHRVLNNVK